MRIVLILEAVVAQDPPADALLVATLAAMSRFSQSSRDGEDCSVLALRVARCLEALADCSALAPALRHDCEQLACLWALLHPGASRPRPALPAGPPRGSAIVLPLRRLRSEVVPQLLSSPCIEEQS
jgi:hypothetical protein